MDRRAAKGQGGDRGRGGWGRRKLVRRDYSAARHRGRIKKWTGDSSGAGEPIAGGGVAWRGRLPGRLRRRLRRGLPRRAAAKSPDGLPWRSRPRRGEAGWANAGLGGGIVDGATTSGTGSEDPAWALPAGRRSAAFGSSLSIASASRPRR